MTGARAAAGSTSARSSSVVRIVTLALGARGSWIALAAYALSWGASQTHPDSSHDVVDTRVYWVQLALVWVIAFGVTRGIEVWPGFGRNRPDGLWIRRLQVGRCGGTALASATAVLAMLPFAIALAVAFDATARSGRDAALADSVTLSPRGGDRLDRGHKVVELVAVHPLTADELVLRPVQVMNRDSAEGRASVDIALDGVRSPDGPYTVDLVSALIRLHPRQRIGRVTVTWIAGDIALEWPLGTARMRSNLDTPRWISAAGVGACALVDLALAFAVAVLCRRALSTPVLHFSAMATLLLLQITGTGTLGAAVAAHARDVFFLDAATRSALATDLGLLGLVMAAAVLPATLRRR